MIGTKIMKPIKDAAFYAEVAHWCTSTQKGTIEERDDCYVVVERKVDESHLLEAEKKDNERWMRDHAYVSALVASGVAAPGEFAEELAEMKRRALRIKEIDVILSERRQK